MIRTKRTANIRYIKEINITPFTDVCLVLLIIFMVTAPVMMKQESNLKLDLPRSAQYDTPVTQSITVYITADEQVTINKTAVSSGQLRTVLGQLQQKYATNMVVIKADQGVPYRRVINVIDISRQVGLVKIALATQQVDGGASEQP